MDQETRKGSPEINPHTDGQLIFDKGGKYIQWDKIAIKRTAFGSVLIEVDEPRVYYTE